MRLSAILTTPDWRGMLDFQACASSLEGEADELVLVGPDEEMLRGAAEWWGGDFVFVEYDGPLAAARNRGAGAATGEAYCFLDMDVTVTGGWGDAIRRALHDHAAAGGPARPVWPSVSRPRHVPMLWDWLVGCGPYHDGVTSVRNTYGCNIAFRADVFNELGGFDEDYGIGARHGQAEEAELAARMREEGHGRTLYDPDAAVYHRVDRRQVRVRSLLRRAFEQGRAKAAMGAGGEEAGFLGDARDLALHGSWTDAAATAAYTAAVGAGFVFGRTAR
jgi:hypothetical protein